MSHPDFAVLTVSWELALRADGYADNTVRAYQNAVRSLADWLAERYPEVGPAELDRQHIRGWLVEVRERHSPNTARGWFAGVRHFCRWLQSEGEADHDATAGIRTPAPGDPETPVLSDADLRDRIVFVPARPPPRWPPAPGGANRGQSGPGAGSLPARAASASVRGHAAALAW